MDQDRPPRPRIQKSDTRIPAIADPQEFTKNLSSGHAKKIGNIAYSLNMQVWIDRHYQNRKDLGDEFGKREGIDQDAVESIIRKSIPHLLHYSTTVPGFAFVNYNKGATDIKTRVTIKERINGIMINVIIECHLIKLRDLEITVITGIPKENFIPFDGEYVIEIEEDRSFLTKNIKKQMIEIAEF